MVKRIKTYNIICLENCGLIEIIDNAETICDINMRKNFSIQNYIIEHNPNKSINENIVGNIPILNISFIFIFVALKVIAFGAVADGSRKDIDTPIAIGMINARGSMLSVCDKPRSTGAMIAAVAVF